MDSASKDHNTAYKNPCSQWVEATSFTSVIKLVKPAYSKFTSFWYEYLLVHILQQIVCIRQSLLLLRVRCMRYTGYFRRGHHAC